MLCFSALDELVRGETGAIVMNPNCLDLPFCNLDATNDCLGIYDVTC